MTDAGCHPAQFKIYSFEPFIGTLHNMPLKLSFLLAEETFPTNEYFISNISPTLSIQSPAGISLKHMISKLNGNSTSATLLGVELIPASAL